MFPDFSDLIPVDGLSFLLATIPSVEICGRSPRSSVNKQFLLQLPQNPSTSSLKWLIASRGITSTDPSCFKPHLKLNVV
jgi:hypothetical protein